MGIVKFVTTNGRLNAKKAHPRHGAPNCAWDEQVSVFAHNVGTALVQTED